MPFSTYLRDTISSDGGDQQQHYPVPQWMYTRDSAGHPSPFKAHDASSAILDRSSSSSASASSIEPLTTGEHGVKSYIPPSSSSSSSFLSSLHRTTGPTGANDGIFQLPAFLMGNFTGTLAPGGGAQVLTPGALGTFDFAGYAPPTPPPPHLPPTYSASAGKTPWQSTKYYTLAKDDEQHDVDRPQSTSTTTTTTTTALPPPAALVSGNAPGSTTTAGSASSTSTSNSTSDPAHGSDPAALASSSSSSASASASSPFGYLNTESPRLTKIINASSDTQTQILSTRPLVEPISLPHPTSNNNTNSNSNPDEPSSAMETNETGSDATSHTPRPPTSSAAGIYSPTPVLASSASSSVIVAAAPSPSAGLPVYSQSGFDMLSILARVARRPNPTIYLGPVDLTCSFVVADVRRADAPIVYASRTFYELTGYTEPEVLGRNCRFLQAPGGRVSRGDLRRFTSPEAVRELRFALDKDREVQVSLINYRKDGRAFVNRVSIVPIPAEDDASEIAFHVGFQVDLNEQPALIAQRMKEGKFYSAGRYADALCKSQQTPAERSARAMGKKLRELLANEEFQAAVQLSNVSGSTTLSANNTNTDAATTDSATAATAAGGGGGGPVAKSAAGVTGTGKPDARDERQWLQLLLLEHMPDFVHVLSLKGHFLYVSPGITRTLGYAPADLIGKSVGDFCHPSDAVPLLRELKESVGQVATTVAAGGAGAGAGAESVEDGGEVQDSQAAQTQMRTTTAGGAGAGTGTGTGTGEGQTAQRPVNLLFRMRNKAGDYTWIESMGRMHVEAGKGRKGVVLSGRMCVMPDLRWGTVSQAGGLAAAAAGPTSTYGEGTDSGEGASPTQDGGEQEFWAMICNSGLFLVASTGVRDLLGWGTAEMIGRSIREFVVVDDHSIGGHQHQHQHQQQRLQNYASASASASPEQVIAALRRAYHGEQGTQSLNCRMKKRDGEIVWMHVVLYANESRTSSGRVIVQFKLLSAPASSATSVPSPTTPYQAYSPAAYVNPTSYSFSFAQPQQQQQQQQQQQHAQHENARTSYTSYGYNNNHNNDHRPFNFDLSGPRTSTNAGRILHAPSTNVFAEFETHRGTSWQYELQQLKYANDKLREQVGILEARQRLRRSAPAPAPAPSSASVYPHQLQPPLHQQNGDDDYYQEQQQQQQQQQPSYHSQTQIHHQMHSNLHHRPQSSRVWVQA